MIYFKIYGRKYRMGEAEGLNVIFSLNNKENIVLKFFFSNIKKKYRISNKNF